MHRTCVRSTTQLEVRRRGARWADPSRSGGGGKDEQVPPSNVIGTTRGNEMESTNPVAFVTGASRGIGRASALALADAGFDVVITARTEREGEGRTESNSVRNDDPIVPIVGSLERTAAEIEARGRRALPIKMDLLDAEAIVAAPAQALREWGHIDVLFNNAIFAGGATMDRILDLTPERMLALMAGNYAHQVLLIQ